MNAERRAPMVSLGCRVPRLIVERIARIAQATGLERCDVIRRALDAGTTAIEEEVANGENGGQS